jgi:hypothetical protein
MISMRRTLLAGVLAALGSGSLGSGNLVLSARCFADPPSCNSPAAYRLFNTSTMGPGTAGCGRYEPIPCPNQGWFLNNPRGTGMDDPWRPPKIWPQTRYPVVPAYTRPSYGYYETSWRVMPLCNPAPAQAGPIFPAGYEMGTPPGMQPAGPLAPPQSGQSGQPAQSGQPGAGQNPPLPRPPVVPPAVQPNQGPPAATPPGANGQFLPRDAVPGGPPTTVPNAPLQPQKSTPPTNELQPPIPKATPPATTPGLRNPTQGAVPNESPRRAAMLELEPEESPEIRVQPF